MWQDNGPGIQPGILSSLGRPFVTSKENGTGLGISICYSIANHHNAVISVETGEDGTTFFVRFPAYCENAERAEREIKLEL